LQDFLGITIFTLLILSAALVNVPDFWTLIGGIPKQSWRTLNAQASLALPQNALCNLLQHTHI
jgi:hypothetical protein